ncbi:MAG: hypothetical protein NUW24_15470 [Anaerolineae bacterium]|jgi:predicted nucleotidyltransferase|nr:hypothetical protein [Anaerolineae bacterium]MDH7474997.1 hypothetical protein [Anaerolineae bacterium]
MPIHPMISQDIREGFALETHEGLIFTVKGLIHPPETVIAYLRYVPAPQGERLRDGVSYRRVYHFDEPIRMLETRFPRYLFFDRVFGRQLQGVPHSYIRRVYDPRHKLAELSQSGGGDQAEEAALRFAELLHRAAEVPFPCLGLSGSILLGLHTSASDLDMVVYGVEAGRRVHRALRLLLSEPSGEVTPLNEQELRALHAAHAMDTGVPLADFIHLQRRKVNEGRYQGRGYFIRFVKDVTETGEKYGDRRYTPLGPARIRALVTDDSETIFTPCRYGLERVRFLVGEWVADLREVVSYRGRFCEQARAGEEIVAQGILERVTSQSDDMVYHRLVVGGQRGDYLVARGEECEADA